MQPATPVLPNSPLSRRSEISIGEDQPEYTTLPALAFDSHTTPGKLIPVDDFFAGDVVLMRYELDDNEIAQLIRTRSLFIAQLHHGEKMQPILPMVDHPLDRITEACEVARAGKS